MLLPKKDHISCINWPFFSNFVYFSSWLIWFFQITVLDEEEPASALDFRIYCASTSISIFDDYDILCRTQTQTLPENEFSSFSSIDPIPLNSTLQFTQEEGQNLNDFGHFQDQKQRHQVGIET